MSRNRRLGTRLGLVALAMLGGTALLELIRQTLAPAGLAEALWDNHPRLAGAVEAARIGREGDAVVLRFAAEAQALANYAGSDAVRDALEAVAARHPGRRIDFQAEISGQLRQPPARLGMVGSHLKDLFEQRGGQLVVAGVAVGPCQVETVAGLGGFRITSHCLFKEANRLVVLA